MQDVDRDQVREQEMLGHWEECSLLEPQKHLLTPAQRQNPISSSWLRQGWPTSLAEVASVAEVAEVGIVLAELVAREKGRILE